MNKENTKNLLTRFPVLYQNYYSSIQESCMPWGFECGRGWQPILWQLSLAIEEELAYTRWQSKMFLLKRKWSRRWNKLVYRISPVKNDRREMKGAGTKENPYHWVVVEKAKQDWLARLALRIFPDRTTNFGVGDKVASLQRLGLKILVWHPYTGFAVDQVKEKFGVLRFYCPGTDRIWAYVTLAERLSAVTCETCGKQGKLRGSNWLYTACDEHTKEKDKNNL